MMRCYIPTVLVFVVGFVCSCKKPSVHSDGSPEKSPEDVAEQIARQFLHAKFKQDKVESACAEFAIDGICYEQFWRQYHYLSGDTNLVVISYWDSDVYPHLDRPSLVPMGGAPHHFRVQVNIRERKVVNFYFARE